MNCRQVEKHVLALLDSTLPPKRAEAMRDHMSRCGDCRALRDFVAETMEEMDRASEVGVSPDFWPRLSRRIEAYEVSRIGWLDRWPHVRPLAAGACLLLGAWAGIVLGGTYSERLFPSEIGPSAVEDVLAVFHEPSGSLAELLIDPSFQVESVP